MAAILLFCGTKKTPLYQSIIDDINNVFFDAPWHNGLMTAYNVYQADEFITNSTLFTIYIYFL